MDGFLRFFASTNGRMARIVAGVILLVVGVLVIGGTVGWIIGIIGLVPLLAGTFDFCVFAPLMGMPFMGNALREALYPAEPAAKPMQEAPAAKPEESKPEEGEAEPED
jgi:hypothetical protein